MFSVLKQIFKQKIKIKIFVILGGHGYIEICIINTNPFSAGWFDVLVSMETLKPKDFSSTFL